MFDKGANHGSADGNHALDVARSNPLHAGARRLPAAIRRPPRPTRSPFELDLSVMANSPSSISRTPRLARRASALALSFRSARHRSQQARSVVVHLLPAAQGKGRTVTSRSVAFAKANIALASLHMPHGRPGDELWAEIYYQRELKWSRVMARCRVVEGAFYDPPRRRATPAADF